MGIKQDHEDEEESPLLNQIQDVHSVPESPELPEPVKAPPLSAVADGNHGWLAHGTVVGEPVGLGRAQWNSSICACLGSNDEFCSSDLEVCLLGSVAPCVLYGSNVERLESSPGTFVNHCLPYSGLYVLGKAFFSCNLLAPWFSYPSRTAIRHKFNLEGTCAAVNRSCGCFGSFVHDEQQLEMLERSCDFATHVYCHACALCQEARELRRRLPHPGFNATPVFVMNPPAEQSMGRGASN